MRQDQQIDIEAWKDLLLRREIEAINQIATVRALMVRIQELEASVPSPDPSTTDH